MATYNLYSSRLKGVPPTLVHDELPQKLRQQLVYLVNDSLGKFQETVVAGYRQSDFMFAKLVKILAREHGLPESLNVPAQDTRTKIHYCLLQSNDTLFQLDIIEAALVLIAGATALAEKSSNYTYPGLRFGEAADDLNCRFRENGVGYHFDVNARQLIRVDNSVSHSEIISPTLALLAESRYAVANDEYTRALKHHRNGDYEDAITNAGAAYESVMRIICDKHNWPYPPKATANQLVKAIVTNAPLEGAFEQVLTGAANVRNLKSSAHGGGAKAREAELHHCLLTLNLAASAMLYLVEEFG